MTLFFCLRFQDYFDKFYMTDLHKKLLSNMSIILIVICIHCGVCCLQHSSSEFDSKELMRTRTAFRIISISDKTMKYVVLRKTEK